VGGAGDADDHPVFRVLDLRIHPGENNDFKLQDEAHRKLDARPQVTRVTIPTPVISP